MPGTTVTMPTMPHRAPPDHEPDSAVIARSLTDPAAFTAIFDRHWSAIRSFCVARAGAAGEDLASEAFCTAFDQRARFDLSQPQARPWLFGIAANLLRRHFRDRQRGDRAQRRLGGLLPRLGEDDTPTRAEAEQLGPELTRALTGLRAEERDALLLHAWAELSYEEIAAATAVPIGTVRSRISRARGRLRIQLPSVHEDLT